MVFFSAVSEQLGTDKSITIYDYNMSKCKYGGINMTIDIKQLGKIVEQKSEFIRLLLTEFDKVIVGQRYMIERMLVAILSNGHILIEGVPGLAKTTAVTVLAKAIKAQFHRLQFTPDLLPADLTGTQNHSRGRN